MAQPKILFSRSARADLLEIEAYVASQSGEARAESVMAKLRATIDLLAVSPGIGRPRFYTEKGELAFPVRRWMVVFEPLDDLDGIHVLYVLDSSRNIASVLNERRKQPR